MTKRKSTKRALLSSVVALLLCFTMLLGSTFAWFTDSVSSVNNVIKAGNLDVVLEYSTDGETWNAVEEDTSIFNENALWEPGHTEAVALRVRNEGTLALKYELSTSVYLEKEGTNVFGETFELSDYLKVYACEPLEAENQITEIFLGMIFEDREKALGSGTAMTEGAFDVALATNDDLIPNESHVIPVAITMPTTVGNEANYKTGTAAPYIRFGINLYATQTPYEEDSFGRDYDEGAAYEKLPVATVTDNGPAGDVYVESLFGGGLFDENDNEHLRDLDATFTFKAPAGDTAYDEWIADYEVTVDAELEEKAAVLAGQYDVNSEKWQASYTPAVKANEPTRLLASQGLNWTYADIRDWVAEFQCGVEDISVPEGTTMTVALKLYKQDENNNVLAEHTVGVFTHTFN